MYQTLIAMYAQYMISMTEFGVTVETAFLPLKKRIKHCIEEIIQGQEKGGTADEELLREMLALVAELDLKGDIETTLHKGIEDFNKAHDAVFSKVRVGSLYRCNVNPIKYSKLLTLTDHKQHVNQINQIAPKV